MQTVLRPCLTTGTSRRMLSRLLTHQGKSCPIRIS